VADEIDIAQELNELHYEQSMRAFRLRVKAPPPNFDGVNCTDCGEPVEPERLKLGFWRCIHCASLLELRRRQGVVK
jgi:hypothetical protein